MRSLKENWYLPEIALAGRQHLAEWSFFLTEYHKRILNYPFFVVSSRFYEKNNTLKASLDDYWDIMFKGLNEYGFGYLPSYDRSLSFIDMTTYYNNPIKTLGTTEKGLAYIKDRFGVDMQCNYNKVSDFWCNYIGFASRDHFEKYMDYYMPVFDEFFDSDFNLKANYRAMGLVREDISFRELKPPTLLLELISHLFFYVNKIPFFGLHYDGTYEVREWEAILKRLSSF